MQVLQLLASFFGPIVAATMVMIGWKRTHTDASSRDLENWRRTTILKSVVEVSEVLSEISISVEFPLSRDETHKFYYYKLTPLIEKSKRCTESLFLCCAPEIHQSSEKIDYALRRCNTILTQYYQMMHKHDPNSASKQEKKLADDFLKWLSEAHDSRSLMIAQAQALASPLKKKPNPFSVSIQKAIHRIDNGTKPKSLRTQFELKP